MPTFEMMELGEGLEEQFDHLVENCMRSGEIDQDLYNAVTKINYVAYVQQCVRIFGNSKPDVANAVFKSLTPDIASFVDELMKLTFEEEQQ